MSLDNLDLDDQEFEELLEDTLKRLPVHSDEWTDHNAHDPGITILETLVWLAETYNYQLDRVTDSHRRKHMRLLGIEPQPPKPATADLQLAPQLPTEEERQQGRDQEASNTDPQLRSIPPEREGEVIPVGEKLIIEDGGGFMGVFETTKPVTLTRASIDRIVTVDRNGLIDNTTANETYGMRYRAFGERATRGSVLYLGFDRDPFEAAEEDIIDITLDYDDSDLPPVESHLDSAVTFTPSVDIVWEYCTDYEDWRSNGSWEAFTVIRDQTNQLYQGGTIALRKTGEWIDQKGKILNQDDEFVWIRCRVKTPGYEIPPRLSSVRLDVVPVTHTGTVENEVLTRPDGSTETTVSADQRFVFDNTPVLEATITVGGDHWDEVTDFDAAGPDEMQYVLDNTRGMIQFGDGINGKVPDSGQRVVAKQYVYGGGERGNVPRSASCRFKDDELAEIPVSLMAGATGGEDAESVGMALTRLRTELDTPDRAVSLDDYRRLATETPGLRIARVMTLLESDDHDTVRVVVVPYSPLGKPQPSEGMLRAVQRHLEKHRLLTDRLRVVAPTYVSIGVDTTIKIRAGYSEQGRIDAIRTALDSFLEPLGETGEDGWPFGRPVYQSELYEVIEHVEGVDAVLSITIQGGEAGERDPNGNVVIGDAALPYPDHHTVRVERGALGGNR